MALANLAFAASTTDAALLGRNFPDASNRAQQRSGTSSPEERRRSATINSPSAMEYLAAASAVSAASAEGPRPSSPTICKTVLFQLISPESPHTTARLPMRVRIRPHDATDSIITTVKNFYGLYSSPTVSKGVSFEDDAGNTLIARHENFRDNMVVYVRVVEEPSMASPLAPFPPQLYQNNPVSTQASQDGYPPHAPLQNGQNISRPASRTSRMRSPSPNGSRDRRSASASTNPRVRSRSSKNRGPAAQVHADARSDGLNGYSSGDGAPGSSSGRSKEHIGNTEISVDNIVEGGRRKRAKFESSELPLFAPPQMPAATSNPSISPARKAEPHRASLPFAHPGQSPYASAQALAAAQAMSAGFDTAAGFATPTADSRRARGSIGYPPGFTPDPTIGSCMSEEDKDVAIQLMRLGEISNISHGRASASTQDDTFSGRADAGSSTGATSEAESESEEDEEAQPNRKQRLDVDGNSKKLFETTESHLIPPRPNAEAGDGDADSEESGAPAAKTDVPMAAPMAAPKLKKIKANPSKPRPQPGAKVKAAKVAKPKQPATGSKVKHSVSNGPMSPMSLPPSRKPSLVLPVAGFTTAPTGEEQPDLSTKPRCQRCRKSKKGCDRQRPCGRCKDAGIPADQCISEDEGNGRKGRYGRHMGVPIKKEDMPAPAAALLPAAPIAAASELATTTATTEKGKKRKR